MVPSFEEYARRWPSSAPENTTPGIAVTAADCAGLQPLILQPLPGDGVSHTFSPVAIFNANIPPPTSGLGPNPSLAPILEASVICTPKSDSAAYTVSESAAGPH